MKIAIDISQVIYQTGVSTYTKEIVKNLLAIDKDNEYLLFGGSLRRMNDLKSFTSNLKGNFKTKFFPLPPSAADYLWNRMHILKIETLIGDIDVLHSSDWSQPPTNAYKVTTVHDLTPLLLPKQTHPKIVSAHKRKMRWITDEVDKVIVPSNSARKDLSNIGVDDMKIEVIPEAPSEIYSPSSMRKVAQVKDKYGINGSFLLCVGNAPRKNIPRTIEAFLKSKEKTNIERLVVVGRGDDSYLQSDDVIFTGHVSEEDLPALYSGSEGLLYTSLYEGFGLPILEAYACGIPVLISDRSSLPEVAGDAAIMVNPEDVRSISEGIEKLISQKKVLIKKGKDRVKDFTWEKTAEETLKIYLNQK